MAKLSDFIIGMIIFSLVTIVFTVGMSKMTTLYNATFDNSSVQVFNQMQTLENRTQSIQQGAVGLKERSGALDLIGSLFTNAYNVLLISKDVFDVFVTMVNAGFDMIGLGELTAAFKTAIILIVIVIIFLGILVSAVVKKDV